MAAEGSGGIPEDERFLTGLKEARRRIAVEKRQLTGVLDISGLGLTDVPEELYEIGPQLKVLYLGAAADVREKSKYGLSQEDKKKCNAVSALHPAFFASLRHLTHLHLEHNQLTGLPDEIAALTGLTSFDLRGNEIEADGARALAALTGLTSLDLGGNPIRDDGARALAALTGLKSLCLEESFIGADSARALAALTGLTSLNLWNNHIGADGARALAALTGLASLDLGGNRIGDDGARALAALTGLTSLNLRIGNQIGADGARALAALTGLTSLDLGSNRIGADGARALAALTGLASLDLLNNGMGDDGARALAALTGLTSLQLGNNQIGDDGARALAALTGLTSLKLGNNQIGDDGARALAALTGLTSLQLGGNRIGDDGARALIEGLHSSTRMTFLNLRENNIIEIGIPAETIESRDAQAIFEAWRAFREAEQRGLLKSLNEAKMLVVGNEAVGKTSLIRYLVLDEACDPKEKKTPGTAIHEKIKIQNWCPEAAEVRLNVWDFGGQEIMHGTHRYFLTRRSLYLLVLEDRREDDRAIYNWLKIIKNRGGDAPIIVVINKSDEGKQALQLNEEGLLREHPEIVGFFRTSCDIGDWAKASIGRLRGVIAQCVAKHDALKQIRDKVPESWLWVKEEIAEKARNANVLRIAEYERLCLEAAANRPGAERLRSEDAQRGLLRLLNDLGVLVVHGLSAEDKTVDPKVALLDPNWLTGAIYTVLNRAELVQQKGKFDRAQLNDWLDAEPYPERRHQLVLDMMQDEEIGLAFELPGSKGKEFLVPEGLPKNSPDHSEWPKDSLRFRFRYEFLPPGLIPRLIVAAHEDLTEKEDRWKSGAVFQYRGSRILVDGNVDKKVIDIAVANGGENRRAALHVMLHHFDKVHRLNPEAKPEALVPAPDDPEAEASYAQLLLIENQQGPDFEFYPRGSERPYRVGDLLDGVGREILDAYSDPRTPSSGERPRPLASKDEDSNPGDDLFRWGLISLGAGLGAVAAVALVYLLPSNWQFPIGGLLALFGAVSAFMFFRNPAWFYKRWIGISMTAGLFWSALGAYLEISYGDTPLLKWKVVADPWIYALVGVAIVVFTWADVRLQLAENARRH